MFNNYSLEDGPSYHMFRQDNNILKKNYKKKKKKVGAQNEVATKRATKRVLSKALFVATSFWPPTLSNDSMSETLFRVCYMLQHKL